MTMHIHRILEDWTTRDAAPFIVQIGAMDGVSGPDPLHAFLIAQDWPAVLVEPLPAHFQSLQETYAHRPLIRTVQAAIADHDGETVMHVVPPDAVRSRAVPPWGHEASSLYADRTALGWDHIRPHVRKVTVPCLTLPTLLAQQDVPRVDILQIDAEGHDYHILRQLDFTRWRPYAVNLEIVNLPQEEQEALYSLLTLHGYRFLKNGYDLVAWR